MKALILGGSGQLGFAMGERLLLDGWDVTSAQRGDSLPQLLALGVKTVRLERSDPGALRGAIPDSVDALIDTIAFDAEHAAQLLELQDVVGQFVVFSSASVYRDIRGRPIDEAKSFEDLPEMPVPIRESQPTVEPGPQTYSTKKVMVERTMLEDSRVPVTIIRPCAIYGPFSKHPREWWFVKRYLDRRRRVPLKYENSVFQTSAAPNVAKLAHVALKARFHGILNAADPDVPSVREIAAIIAGGLSWDCEFITVPPEVENVGITPWTGAHPFVLDMGAAEFLGYTPLTSYDLYAPETCRWLIDAVHGKEWREIFPVLRLYPDLFDYAAEDAFFSQWHL